METFSAIRALCAGNSPVTGEIPEQNPVTQGFEGFFFICAWISGWVNNREAGDLRRNHSHYDVIVMYTAIFVWITLSVMSGFVESIDPFLLDCFTGNEQSLNCPNEGNVTLNDTWYNWPLMNNNSCYAHRALQLHMSGCPWQHQMTQEKQNVQPTLGCPKGMLIQQISSYS